MARVKEQLVCGVVEALRRLCIKYARCLCFPSLLEGLGFEFLRPFLMCSREDLLYCFNLLEDVMRLFFVNPNGKYQIAKERLIE